MRTRCLQAAAALSVSVSLGLAGCNSEAGSSKDKLPPVTRGAATSADASDPAVASSPATSAPVGDMPVTPTQPAPTKTPPPAAVPDVAMPEVLLTDGHAALCKVKAGDMLPIATLPNLEGQPTDLKSLFGERLTVVVFFAGDRWMAREQLADMGPQIAQLYGSRGVQVVGIAVKETPETAKQLASEAGVDFPILIDADGAAFAEVGSEKLPRTYLLDATGKILWFDIEYSRSTRRELRTGLSFALGDAGA